MSCEYVNTKSVNGPTFKSLKHMNQHMAEEAQTQLEEKEGATIEDKDTND